MKNLAVFIIFILGVFIAKADFLPTLEYKVHFELKGSISFDAYYLTYDDSKIENNIGSLDSLFLNTPKGLYDTITVYIDIISLDSLALDINGWVINATPEQQIRKININDIIKTTVISYRTYPWSCNSVIRGLTETEIQKLKLHRPDFIIDYKNCFEHDLIGVFIVSYTSTMSKKELVEMFNQKCCDNFDGSSKSYLKMEKGFLELKEALKSKDIIVFKYCTGN